MEALPIHHHFTYTRHLPGLNFVLVESCRHLKLMVLVITSSGYPFFNKVLPDKIEFIGKFWLGVDHLGTVD